MKKKMMLALLFCGFLSSGILLSASPVLAFENEPDGFRGLKWGDSPGEDMVYNKTVNEMKAYLRNDDKMNIGDASLRMVIYTFYDEPERFAGILVLFDKEKNYDILKDILQVRFGEETESDWLYGLSWMGQKTYIKLDYDPAEESGDLIFSSISIMLEAMEAQKQKQAEKAEGDF